MAIIDKPTDYFNTVLYTGNGGTQSVTGFGHAPDLTWTKERNNAKDHSWYDSVRGANQLLESNNTGTDSVTSAGISSFDSDGFTTGNFFQTNDSGDSYVSWGWKAGGTASSNTNGSITSSVSANQDAGFSIVSYTGTGANATVGHGLGVAPSMIIVKNRDNIDNWTVYHGSQGGTKVQWLNLTNATATESGWWNNTDPTTSVFYIGTQNGVNQSGNSMITYCFADVQGYSKFGSYTGNGNSDGTFVYTGFKPAWVLWKRSDDSTGRDWQIYDNKRSTFNELNKRLRANTSDAETTSTGMDFTSNGFKLRTSDGNYNASGANYIYMCFAENPFVSSTGVPATAR